MARRTKIRSGRPVTQPKKGEPLKGKAAPSMATIVKVGSKRPNVVRVVRPTSDGKDLRETGF